MCVSKWKMTVDSHIYESGKRRSIMDFDLGKITIQMTIEVKECVESQVDCER